MHTKVSVSDICKMFIMCICLFSTNEFLFVIYVCIYSNVMPCNVCVRCVLFVFI